MLRQHKRHPLLQRLPRAHARAHREGDWGAHRCGKPDDARPFGQELLLGGVDAQRLGAAARRQEPYDDRVGEAAAHLRERQALQASNCSNIAQITAKPRVNIVSYQLISVCMRRQPTQMTMTASYGRICLEARPLNLD